MLQSARVWLLRSWQPPLQPHCLDPSRSAVVLQTASSADGALHCFTAPRDGTLLERQPAVAGRPNARTHARCGRARVTVEVSAA